MGNQMPRLQCLAVGQFPEFIAAHAQRRARIVYGSWQLLNQKTALTNSQLRLLEYRSRRGLPQTGVVL